MQRNRLHRSIAGTSLAIVAAVAPVLAPPASAITTHRTRVVLRATDSNGGQYAGGTGSARISEDGDWLAFSRLTGTGSYRKNLVSGETTLVSVNDNGQPANAPSSIEGISSSGDVVLFSTAATNMGQEAPTARDLYVRTISTGNTDRVNFLGGTGTAAAVKPGENALSSNGGFVAFTTAAGHVYVRVWATHVTDQIDVSSAELPGNGTSGQPSINAYGRYVTFTTFSSDFVPGDNNFVSDVFERDRVAGTTTRVSLSDTEVAPNLASNQSSVSDDGTAVAFSSSGDNLVAGDTNTDQDVFIRYLSNNSTYRVSLGTGGTQGNGVSGHPDVSANGDRVAFESKANLDYNATNPHGGVFLRDLSGNMTLQQGIHGSQGVDQAASAPSLASTNGAVAFVSAGTNLVTNDTNGASDAFVDRYEQLGPFTWFDPMASTLRADFGAPGGADAATYEDLVNGRITPGHLIVTLAHGQPWAEHRQPVARLYQAFFHREPDLNGLNHWVKKRQGGTKLGVIAASFAASSEFKTAYGSVDNHDFVVLVYGNVLQRKPDTAGLNHWIAKLAGGMSRGDLMVAFSESSEGRRILAPEVDSSLIGLAMLHKMPSNALWLQAAAAHRNHGVAEWGAVTYLNSVEFVNLIAP